METLTNTADNITGTSTNYLNSNWVGDFQITPYTPLITTYYPDYTCYWNSPSKIETSFKIVQKLMEKKVIKEPKTIKNFIELVNTIAEIV